MSTPLSGCSPGAMPAPASTLWATHGQSSFGRQWRARAQRGEAARLFAAGKRKLDELDAALDPDDQFEFDWIATRLAT